MRVESSVNELREQRKNLNSTFDLAIKRKEVVLDQLKIAETQIKTGQADIAKVFDLKLSLHELEASIRNTRAELRRVEYELGALLGVFDHTNESRG
jgi:outer membrane protein TolC